ncbi:MAG TPA: hypothetical protein VFJ24_05945 [Gaiellales bacterium]|nr:hypothetical protein [Gaiellales bacterium]
MAKTRGSAPAPKQRTRAYTVRYNEDEDTLIADAAAEKALEVASWIRMVSIEAAREAKRGKGGGR